MATCDAVVQSETSESDFELTGNLDITGGLYVGDDIETDGAMRATALELVGPGVNPVLTGDGRAIVWTNPATAKPTDDKGAALIAVADANGRSLAINVGGNVWKWLAVTSVRPV